MQTFAGIASEGLNADEAALLAAMLPPGSHCENSPLAALGAEAGAEYRLGKVFGVYVAPGVEYHFDNGAEARSAYTEKPLHWNVALGVRFNFGN